MNKWIYAFRQILPVYITVHVMFILLTLFVPLFSLGDFSVNSLPMYTLLQEWNRWDTGQYTAIAMNGYNASWHTAFFPLFPLLERLVSFGTKDLFIAGIVISNLADLGLLVVFYQLTKEDFGEEHANHAVLYISIFPSAFFFISAYTESLFLFLSLLSFYQIRRGHFWLAGIFAFFACLTRSTGIFLMLPLAYTVVQRKQVRIDILSLILPVLGISAYSAYCYYHFGDFLAWEHAQSVWHHQLMMLWETVYVTIDAIRHISGLLSFQGLHNCLDLISVFFISILLLRSLRWLPKVYLIYAVPLYFFLLSVPIIWTPLIPLQSVPRFILEVFPVFIINMDTARNKWLHNSYLLLSGLLVTISCALFLSGHWMV